MLDAMEHFAVSHDAEVPERVAFGKSMRLDLSHFDDGGDVFAKPPALLTLWLACLPCLAPFLLRACLGLFGHRLAVDGQLARINLLAQLLSDGRDLLRALAKQATVERFHLLDEPLDELAVLGELRAKL